MFWRGRPFLRILLFFASGILVARYWFADKQLPITEFILLLVSLILISAVIANHIKSFKYSWVAGLILNIALFVAGFTLTVQQIRQSRVKLDENPQAVWEGKLLTEPTQRAKAVKFILKIIKRADNGSILPRSVNVMAYLKTNTLPAGLHLGSFLVFHGKMSPIEAPKNPGEFDYRRFLQNRGIRYRVFMDKMSWKLLPVQGGFLLPAVFSRWRNRLLQSLRSQGLSHDEYAVAAAILLGDDQLIAPDLHQDFTAAGAVHILVVSGMHVGIIFLIFGFLFRFLLRFKNGDWLRNVLLILVIWSYALLTGLSPSVSRAATMISLFILADIFRREYDNFNILAASAFLLLLLNPLLLFDVGFQLSYAAVAGILMFYFPIYRSLYFGNKIFQTLWAALVISFSAEMGVFAIAAHYFHQFPLYFLLTNLAVFALSYLIIFSGLAFLSLSWIPVVNHLLAIVLAMMIHALIVIVRFVASMPFSAVYDLYFPWFKVLLIFMLLIWCYYLFVHKNLYMLTPALATLVLLLGVQTFRQFKLQLQDKIIIYSLRHHIAIDLISGKRHILLVDSLAMVRPSELDYSLKNSRIAMGLSENSHPLSQDFHADFVYYRMGFGQMSSLKFYVPPPGKLRYPELHKKIRIDYLIYRSPGKTKLMEIAKSIKFRQIILGASLPSWAVRSLEKQAKLLHINYLNLRETGAFTLDIIKK